MMDFSLTKEELEEKLRALDSTRDSFEPVGIFAMCYSPVRMMPDAVVTKTCEGCGRRFDVVVRSYGVRSILGDYRQVAKGFRDLGYDARILYYCDECVNERSLPSLEGESTNVFFGFKAKGEEEYRLTPLNQEHCDDAELRMVLEFLMGVRSYQELDKGYISHSLFDTADGIKECIERVLGLEPER